MRKYLVALREKTIYRNRTLRKNLVSRASIINRLKQESGKGAPDASLLSSLGSIFNLSIAEMMLLEKDSSDQEAI